MLQNDYLVVKIGVGSAENEPRKEWCVVAMESETRERQGVQMAVQLAEQLHSQGVQARAGYHFKGIQALWSIAFKRRLCSKFVREFSILSFRCA